MPTNFELSLSGATWVDVNTRVTQNPLPDRIPDSMAIVDSSFYNLFNCPIGNRGKIFQPEYGSELYWFLQQPTDAVTAAQMRIALVQAIARWEPRVTLDFSKTFIKPIYELPGYLIRIVGIDNLTKEPIDVQWEQPTLGS